MTRASSYLNDDNRGTNRVVTQSDHKTTWDYSKQRKMYGLLGL